MNIYPEQTNIKLPKKFSEVIKLVRGQRNFDPQTYIQSKITLINAYLRNANLKSVVIGISGGIDSALCLALIKEASNQENSPIQEIIAVTIPCSDPKAASKQEAAKQTALTLGRALGINIISIDIKAIHALLTSSVDKAVNTTGNDWSRGQSVAHVRTMTLAYLSTLQQQKGKNTIIIGTTNKDEGAYLGYVGKYSDGLVDLQIISDLHKSEVYTLSKMLNIPSEIINRAPTGDMYDSREDTDVFGAEYDFVEYMLHKKGATKQEVYEIEEAIQKHELKYNESMLEMEKNLESLHKYNSHKYQGNQVSSPAFHLDILKSSVSGGWKNTLPTFKAPDVTEDIILSMPGGFIRKPAKIKDENNSTSTKIELKKSCNFRNEEAIHISNLLDTQECASLFLSLYANHWIAVGENGMKAGFKLGDKIGSRRATTFMKETAEALWEKIKKHVPPVEYVKEGTSIDAQTSEVWIPVGINAKFSYISYLPEDKGTLVTHYDAPFVYDEETTTLKSCILYLTKGTTRFIDDKQKDINPMERDLSDWNRNATSEEAYISIDANPGDALIFNHRVLHDSDPKIDKRKLIIRTDIVYKKVKTP